MRALDDDAIPPRGLDVKSFPKTLTFAERQVRAIAVNASFSKHKGRSPTGSPLSF
jgi:hypothetical protein